MNIIVVGCGKIGSAIIESLTGEGHNLIAMDMNIFVMKTAAPLNTSTMELMRNIRKH